MGTRQATGMVIPGDDINYKYFASYSQPLGDTYAFGVSVFTWNPRPMGMYMGEMISFEYTRPWVSIGAHLPNAAHGGLAVGANVSFGQASLAWSGEKEKMDGEIGFDLSLLYRVNEQWSFGLLVQDINEPTYSLNGSPILKWKRNIRPGVAYRPNENWTLSMDVYDLSDGQYLMIGAEYWVSDQLGIRGGMYSLGGADFATIGGSYAVTPAFRLEVTAMDFEHVVLSGTYTFP